MKLFHLVCLLIVSFVVAEEVVCKEDAKVLQDNEMLKAEVEVLRQSSSELVDKLMAVNKELEQLKQESSCDEVQAKVKELRKSLQAAEKKAKGDKSTVESKLKSCAAEKTTLESDLKGVNAKHAKEVEAQARRIEELTNKLSKNQQGLYMIAFERAKLYTTQGVEAVSDLYEDAKPAIDDATEKAQRKFAYFYQKQFLPVVNPVVEQATIKLAPHANALNKMYDEKVKVHVDVVGEARVMWINAADTGSKAMDELKLMYKNTRGQAVDVVKSTDSSMGASTAETIVDTAIYCVLFVAVWVMFIPALTLALNTVLYGAYFVFLASLALASLCAGMLVVEYYFK